MSLSQTTNQANSSGEDRRGLRAMFASQREAGGGGGGGGGSRLRRGSKLLVDLRRSFRKLDSSHRLSVTCSGSDLCQLYLSSPEQDAIGLPYNGDDGNCGGGGGSPRRGSSWLLHAADPYGRRRSFRRMSTYERFLDSNVMDDIYESDEERMMLIEEETAYAIDDGSDEFGGPMTAARRRSLSRRRCSSPRWLKSTAVVVPTMMALDLILGVSLSLYDSNLLRNVPGFRFPICYALTQKTTNALASLVLIFISRRWEAEELARRLPNKGGTVASSTTTTMTTTELPSARSLRRHAAPLAAVALAQTISASFANNALRMIPLPLFKVCLMCGPIFVAIMTSVAGGIECSNGRPLALSLIGAGACRAVYAEAGGADDPRYVMAGAGYALGASAFSGLGLVLSGVLMHRREDDEESGLDVDDAAEGTRDRKADAESTNAELNPLSLLFYLSCCQVLMLGAYLCPWDIFSLQFDEEGEGGRIEERGEFAQFTIYFVENTFDAIYYLAMGSAMSLSLAVLTFVLVNRTSPVATSLLGNVRSIATVFISSLVFGSVSAGPGSIFGYSLTLAGGLVYALAALGNSGPPSK